MNKFLIQGFKAVHHLLRLAQHQLALGQRCRIFGSILQAREEIVQGIAQAGGFAAKQVIQARQFRVQRFLLTKQRGVFTHLLRQIFVRQATDVGDADTSADRARAGALRRLGFKLHLLTAVARRVGIGDVVTGGVQRRLVSEDTGQTNIDKSCHNAYSSALPVPMDNVAMESLFIMRRILAP